MPNSNIWALVAGHPDGNYGDVDGVGAAARFNSPRGVGVDALGNYAYVADYGNKKIKRVDLRTAQVETLISTAPHYPVWGYFNPYTGLYFVWCQSSPLNKNNPFSTTYVYNTHTETFSTWPYDSICIFWPYKINNEGFHPHKDTGGGHRYFKEASFDFTYGWTASDIGSIPNCEDPYCGPVYHSTHIFSSWGISGWKVGFDEYFEDTEYYLFVHQNASTMDLCVAGGIFGFGYDYICFKCEDGPPRAHTVISEIEYLTPARCEAYKAPFLGKMVQAYGLVTITGKIIELYEAGPWRYVVPQGSGNHPIQSIGWSHALNQWIGVTQFGNWDNSTFNVSGSTNGTGWNQVVALGSPWVVGSVRVADSGLTVW